MNFCPVKNSKKDRLASTDTEDRGERELPRCHLLLARGAREDGRKEGSHGCDEVVLPGPRHGGAGGPRERRVRARAPPVQHHRRRHAHLVQGHAGLGKTRLSARTIHPSISLSQVARGPQKLFRAREKEPHCTPHYLTNSLSTFSDSLTCIRQEPIHTNPIFMTPLERDLKEYYTPGRDNNLRDKEIEQMKEVSARARACVSFRRTSERVSACVREGE